VFFACGSEDITQYNAFIFIGFFHEFWGLSCPVADKNEVDQSATSKTKALIIVGVIAIVTIGVAVGVGLLVSMYVNKLILWMFSLTLCCVQFIIVLDYLNIADYTSQVFVWNI